MRSYNNPRCARSAPTEFSTRAFIWPNQRAARLRRGAAAVFGLILTVSLVTLMAVTIDFGYIHVAQTQLRRSADAAAMAACWEMYDQQVATNMSYVSEQAARTAANETAILNVVGQDATLVSNQDLILGTYGLDGSWNTTVPSAFNAARLTLRRESSSNGELPLFFGSFTGRDTQSLHVTVTAAMFNAISGFYEPGESNKTIGILPIAVDLQSWLDAVDNVTADDYTCVNGVVGSGPDGVCEVKLYPNDVNGAAGNCGTVDIGGDNNTTADLARQILHGISEQDFMDLGKPLMLDANGELELNGDPGISAGVKDELATLCGKKRIIPIYSTAAGSGNNAMFVIVRFEGVTILDVKLTGHKKNKRLIIQPCKAVAYGAKIDYTGTYTSSHLVTPVMLVE